MPTPNSIGVYFSANDVVYDWAIAFLNSFRTFNPGLRLILIPFNDQCERLLALQDTYQFEIYQDPTFARLEAIGHAFELGHTPTGPYWFRRYAAFWGPLAQFMYLDARQVVLADLKPIISALDDYDFDFLHYDCALNQVYEPGPFRQNLLRQGLGRGFNSGRWISRRDLFSMDEFEQLATDALKIRNQLNPRNTDQAFINYCCDMKPVRYSHFAELLGGICQNGWAHQPGTIYKVNNGYYIWDYGGLDHKKQLPLLHWAGYQRKPNMPHSKLFYYFLLKGQPLLRSATAQFTYRLSSLTSMPFISIRQNRIINSIYHQTLTSKQ
ncbi:MAG: hypothetical protein H6633_06655 [Anaerolineales bacterium]|nr:hypothetical protein [Anaerolineales bacterium]